jgi:uncharacterized protein YecA (UPF0149 family)
MEKSIENSVANYLLYSMKEGIKNFREGIQVASSNDYSKISEVKNLNTTSAEIGRNDPCPCGSGKKYKKCHGA